MRRPFFWKARGAWYVKTNDRRNVRLSEDEDAALKVWAEMVAASSPESPTAPVAALAENFLRWAKAGVAKKTYRGYSDYLVSFCNEWKWPLLSPAYLAYQRRFGRGEKAQLKADAGVGKGQRFGVAGNKGLLTKAQQKRWNGIFAAMLARLLLSMSPAEAKQRTAQIAWAKLKAEGAKTLIDVFGHRTVQILRDTGVLLNSLSPGKLTGTGAHVNYAPPSAEGGEDQVFEAIGNGVIVGTNVPYAASHNYGDPKRGIPKRQFLPAEAPQVWLDRWADVANQALSIGIRAALEAGA
ncbi:MAG: hypothetical protein WD872_17670 [Pirellulaceae bacterium]